jgi:hypothetical protein
LSGARALVRLAALCLSSALALGCGNGHVDGPATSGAAGSSTVGAAGASGTTGVAGQSATGAAGAAGESGSGAAGQTSGTAGAATGTAGAGGSSSTGAAGSGDAGAGAAGASTAGAAGTMAQPDAGADAAPSTSCEGRLVCEDFEKTAVGAKPGAPFTIHASKGTVTVDDTRAHSGTHSLKVSLTATTSTDTYRQAMLAVTGAPLIPIPNNHLYGRFMITTDRIPDKTVHWTIAHGDGPVAALTGTYNYGGMGGLMANYYRDTTPDPNDCWQTKQSAFPTGHWTCVGFEFDGGANEMRFSLDGVEVPELHVVGLAKTDATCTVKGVDGRWLAPMPSFKNISVGWESYQHDAMGAHDAWIDDVVLDTKPIACP